MKKTFRIPPWGWIFLLVFAVFAPTLRYGFLTQWDDDNFILNNARMVWGWGGIAYYWTHNLQDLYTPLSAMSLMIDRAFFGEVAWGFHLHNILLHALAAALMFAVGRRMGIRDWILTGAVCFWALHDQRAESVAWIAERKDVLSTALALGSVLCALRGEEKRRALWAAAVLGALAVFAKPSTAGLCVIFPLLAFRAGGGDRRRSLLRAALPAGAVLSATILSGIMAAGGMGHFSGWARATSVVIHNFFWYFNSVFLPGTRNPVYPRITEVWPQAVIFAVLFGAILIAARKSADSWKDTVRTYGGWALVWGAFFFPTAGWIEFNNTDYCDRYNELPSMVLILAFAVLLCALRSKYGKYRKILTFLLPAAALVELIFLQKTLPIWSDSAKLFEHAATCVELPNAKAVEGWAMTAVRDDDPQRMARAAVLFARRASALEGLSGRWDRDTGFFFQGLAFSRAGHLAKALVLWDDLAARKYFFYTPEILRPLFYGAYSDALFRAGRKNDGIAALKKQLEYLDPAEFAAWENRGLTALAEGCWADAAAHLQKALRLRPDDVQTLRRLEFARSRMLFSR